ncbi:MAG: hypothetical protein RBT63_00525 [Bdellovibrionales bacterium]|jgi:hypothetical protein|nr:hypothetical protein [Bdellovibrionales bacterium]
MKNASLNVKMAGLFIAFALGAIAIAGIGLRNVYLVNQTVEGVISTNVPRTTYAMGVQGSVRKSVSSELSRPDQRKDMSYEFPNGNHQS